MTDVALSISALKNEPDPTRDDPEFGRLLLGDVMLSEAFRVVDDDGAHIFQSTEFDVYGEGDSWEAAFENFVGHAEDLFSHVAELADSERTEHESAIAVIIGTRLVEAYRNQNEILERENKELQSRKESLLAALNLRRREAVDRQRQKTWHPDPLQRENSAPLLSV